MSLSEKLVELVKQVRPSWNEEVIRKCIREAFDEDHPPPHIIHAMMKATTDPVCETPRGFFMPRYWPAESPQAHVKPARCTIHPSEYEHNCGGCKYEHLDPVDPPPREPGTPMPESVRAQLRRRKRDHSEATRNPESPEIP